MGTRSISSRFKDIEVIPGNGHSPYTGCLVFRSYDNKLKDYVAVKSSDGIKNKHKTVEEEYEFLSKLNHPGVIRVLDYYEEDGIQYMIMPGNYSGGRRNRWREIFQTFDEFKTRIFMKSLMNTLFYLQEHDVLHEDIECANMLYRAETVEPILIDFGRAVIKKYSKEWLVNQLSLDKITKQNAFFREITNTGGVYVKEPPHFNFNVKNLIIEVISR
jgi:serine/threonine protein kinase